MLITLLPAAPGLDPGARRRLWQTIQKLKEKRGPTILLTTHYMDEAEVNDARTPVVSLPALTRSSLASPVCFLEGPR